MKNKFIKSACLGLLSAAGLMLSPTFALGQTTQPTTPTPAAPMPDTRIGTNVSGKVEAKSTSTLTVAGRTITINSSTTFSRSGASIGSGDIKVGDKVNVVTTEGGQVATSVEVLSSE
ncbi:MAG: hypothetical protein JWM32_1120 [Verrucomicrobia bacterium]|nr:hypothetical protein [Verrucomicrobiota bacterium]